MKLRTLTWLFAFCLLFDMLSLIYAIYQRSEPDFVSLYVLVITSVAAYAITIGYFMYKKELLDRYPMWSAILLTPCMLYILAHLLVILFQLLQLF